MNDVQPRNRVERVRLLLLILIVIAKRQRVQREDDATKTGPIQKKGKFALDRLTF